jgi:imidazoleglycerol-phosphate dehydratase
MALASSGITSEDEPLKDIMAKDKPHISSETSAEGRTADVKRSTKETQISVHLNLDGTGECRCELNVPFFSHMINLLARHALMDIDITGTGDVEIDAHHTVEDAGITLGQAFRQALGDRAGIERYGEAYVPMEESLARCVLDVCNRSYLKFDCDIPKTKVGDFDAELGEEFFRAFVNNAGITMHLTLLAGGNVHHMLEAMFKATGRALGKAVARNPRIHGVFSTKGAL